MATMSDRSFSSSAFQDKWKTQASNFRGRSSGGNLGMAPTTGAPGAPPPGAPAAQPAPALGAPAPAAKSAPLPYGNTPHGTPPMTDDSLWGADGAPVNPMVNGPDFNEYPELANEWDGDIDVYDDEPPDYWESGPTQSMNGSDIYSPQPSRPAPWDTPFDYGDANSPRQVGRDLRTGIAEGFGDGFREGIYEPLATSGQWLGEQARQYGPSLGRGAAQFGEAAWNASPVNALLDYNKAAWGQRQNLWDFGSGLFGG